MSFSVSYTVLAIDKFTNVARKVKNAAKKYENTMKGLRKTMLRVSKSMGKLGQKMIGIGQAMALRITAPALAAVAAYSKFESGLTNVLTLLDQGQVKEFGKDLEKVQEMAVKMGFSIDDSSKALFDNISALGASKSSIATFKEAQKLAIAGVTDLSISVDGLTSIMNAYGKDTTNAL